MKNLLFKNAMLLSLLLTSLPTFSNEHNHKLDYQNLENIFKECRKANNVDSCLKKKLRASSPQFRSSRSVSNGFVELFNETPRSDNACENGSFENGITGWQGFRMSHSYNTVLENGLSPQSIFLDSTCRSNSSSGDTCLQIESGGFNPAVPSISRTFSGNSLRMGGDVASSVGKASEGISKKFIVTAANSTYYFKYAIVMDQSHTGAAFFQARAIDSTGATVDKLDEVADASNPFISKNPRPMNYRYDQYYRNWRCGELDLRSHIGQEVTVYFVNSDCSGGAHYGTTYIDDVCVECDNSKEEGSIDLDYQACHKDGDSFDISGTFSWPTITGITGKAIELEIYQANVLVGTITSPTITGSNYSFNLTSSDFTNLGCFDIVAVQKYSFPDMNGMLQEVKNYSSKPLGGIQQGTKLGADNDICFSGCEPPKPKNCLAVEPKLECIADKGWQVSFTNNTSNFNPTKLDITSLTPGVSVISNSPTWSLSGTTPNSTVLLSANGIIESGGSEKGNDLCCSSEVEIEIPDEDCPIIDPPNEFEACMLAETTPAGPFFDSGNNQWSFPLALTSLNSNVIDTVKVIPVTAGVTMTNGATYPLGTPSLSFTGVTVGQSAEFNLCAYNSSDKENNDSYDCCKMNVKLDIRESKSPKDYQQLEIVK